MTHMTLMTLMMDESTGMLWSDKGRQAAVCPPMSEAVHAADNHLFYSLIFSPTSTEYGYYLDRPARPVALLKISLKTPSCSDP
jgi:hypothetical protein